MTFHTGVDLDPAELRKVSTSAAGGGGDPSTLVCPAGSFLHRIRTRTGARVDQLSVTCAQASHTGYPENGETTITDTETQTFGGHGRSVGPIR
ncbi:MAG: hypothetical protein AAFX99_11505 [Myxococcota bacterium]